MTKRRRLEQETRRLLDQAQIHEPPVPVETLAQRLGLNIRLQPLESDISGFLYQDGRQAVIGVNARQAPVRQRFTMAHEIGHYVLHQEQRLHVDRGFILHFRADKADEDVYVEEKEANYFAASLLMPRHFLEKDLVDVEEFDFFQEDLVTELTQRYAVSTQALLIQLTSMGFMKP